MKIYRVQFASAIDNIVEGVDLTKMPYPFFITRADGKVQNQELWRGDPLEAIGLQYDLAKSEVNMRWEDYVSAMRPEFAKGKYLITKAKDGTYSTHTHAIESVEVWEGPG